MVSHLISVVIVVVSHLIYVDIGMSRSGFIRPNNYHRLLMYGALKHCCSVFVVVAYHSSGLGLLPTILVVQA